MKKGLIIYNDHDKKLNEWFVESCLKSLNNDEFSLFYNYLNYLLQPTQPQQSLKNGGKLRSSKNNVAIMWQLKSKKDSLRNI